MIVPGTQVTTNEVKVWKGLHLLHFTGSSCSQKVRILLNEKLLAYESHPVSLATMEHTKPWFLGVNPRGVVPVLVHDGVVHIESNDILKHLDQLPSSRPSCFPTNHDEQAIVNRSLDKEDELHVDLRNITMYFNVPKTLAQKNNKTLERYDKNGMQDPSRAMEVKWWRDFAKQGVLQEVALDSVVRFQSVFVELDGWLQNRQWLIGERISLLDISWFISVHRLVTAGYPLQQHLKLHNWYQALCGRPSFYSEVNKDFLLNKVISPSYQFIRRRKGLSMVALLEEYLTQLESKSA